MTTWPIIDREPVQLPVLPGYDAGPWETLIELTEIRPGEWTLIGGQMVALHALEHGVALPRLSTDLDVMVNARIVAGGVAKFVAVIEAHGFSLVGSSPEGIAHRYSRAGVSVDVLAPEGLGSRVRLTTTPPGRTLQVPGGTQALDRTELLPVRFGESLGLVPRPSLVGAIVTKASAVGVDDVPNAQRVDLALLLSLVDDPIGMADQLTPKDRKRIRARDEMANPDQRAWSAITSDAADRGRAAYALLAR